MGNYLAIFLVFGAFAIGGTLFYYMVGIGNLILFCCGKSLTYIELLWCFTCISITIYLIGSLIKYISKQQL